jgi:hypothetical protein
MSEKPPWRQAIEQYERSIGKPLEDFVKSDEFAEMAAKAAKGQAQVQRELASSTTDWLHSMNLPAASDIAELRAEVRELRAEVQALRAELAPPAKATSGRKRAPAKAASKRKATPAPKPKPKPE